MPFAAAHKIPARNQEKITIKPAENSVSAVIAAAVMACDSSSFLITGK